MESNEVNPSFFPPPPPRYKLFTDQNLKLANRLIENQSYSIKSKPFDPATQAKILSQTVSSEPLEINNSGLDKLSDVDLRTLIEPPNLDWIRENGGWTSFGDWEPWPDKPSHTNLEGMPKLYDEKMERKEALQALLNTMIHSYLELLDVLGNEGPTSLSAINEDGQAPLTSKADQIVSHIELTAFNMHDLCNQLRPSQAKETLKLMMCEQAREKREKAKMVLETCEQIRAQLSQLNIKAGKFEGLSNPESSVPRSNNNGDRETDSDVNQQKYSNLQRFDYQKLLSTIQSIF